MIKLRDGITFIRSDNENHRIVQTGELALHGKLGDYTITKITFRTIPISGNVKQDECVVECEQWYDNGNSFKEDELLKAKFIAKLN